MSGIVEIRFTSSLTPEDENVLAPAILSAVTGLLDLMPIAYVIRIDTADAQTYHHTSAEPRPVERVSRSPRHHLLNTAVSDE